MTKPLPCELPEVTLYSVHMARSLADCAGEMLVEGWNEISPAELSRRLYDAPFALVSHGVQADPVFCYANRTAQDLWEYGWNEFTRMPSRLSAEPQLREERAGLLQQAQQNGVIRNYSGIRISRTGKRFAIENTLLWNILDDHGNRIGQAAMFRQWSPVD